MLKSIRIVCVLGMLIVVSGCGKVDRLVAGYTGDGVKTCVATPNGGVTYIQFTSGATVLVDRDGKPVPCEK